MPDRIRLLLYSALVAFNGMARWRDGKIFMQCMYIGDHDEMSVVFLRAEFGIRYPIDIFHNAVVLLDP